MDKVAKILYVEDHPPAQMLMQAIIGELTLHQLSLANSGAQAETLAATVLPDLYIVDLDLPDTDGISLAAKLKAIHAAPVLLVSAYGEAAKESANVMTSTIINAYLAKPLDPDHVTQVITRTLG